MKLRKALSLTALLAGAGLGLAQETPSGVVAVPSGKPAPVVAGPGAIPTQGELAYSGNGCVGASYSCYGGVEYLLWQVGATFRSHGSDRLPAFRNEMPYGFVFRSLNIVTAGDGQGITTNQVGSLAGTASITPFVFSGNNLDSTDRNGFRLTLGMMIDPAQEMGVEARFFQVERRPVSFSAIANGALTYSPGGFENVIFTPGQDPATEQTTFVANANANIRGESANSLYGFDANVTKTCVYIGTVRFQCVAGLRYLNFEEDQILNQSLNFTNGLFIFSPADTTLTSTASSRNQFLGGQLGGRFEGTIGNFFVNGQALVAVGGMRHETTFNESVNNAAGVDLSSVYPFPTSVHESRTRLTFVPELQASAGYAFTDNCRLTVGYDLLFIRRIVRPNGSNTPIGLSPDANGGTVVDLGVTRASTGPLSNFGEENLVAHGWHIGLELRY